MEEKNKLPFPQANDFVKIFLIINMEDEDYLHDNQFLKKYLSLGTDRQISYYVSACEFLGIIDRKRNFTEEGREIRKLARDLQVLKLSRKITSLPVFGEVFFMKYIYNTEMSTEEIAELISTIYKVDNISVCNRRASTVTSWLNWIEKQKLILE